jgi:glycosyltransferase involved in cell wall biosynthesis
VEPAVAWKAVKHAISEGHEVWTITEKSGYEAPMLSYLRENPLPGYHPVFFELSGLLVKLRRPGMIGSVYYHLWQRKLMEVAAELHAKVRFDLAQHVTFARYWSPSGVRDLGIPFIWGPVGAAESAPPSFVTELPIRSRIFEFVRDGVRRLSRLDPALRDTARKATISIGITRETCQALRELGAPRVEQLPLSLNEDELGEFDNFPPPPSGPFRVLCLGRLLHWKGFYLAIRAFAIFAKSDPEAELWIVGGGPFRVELEKAAQQSGVASRIRFFGHLTPAAAVEKLAHAHVLLHPALHEAFGNVCLEAMACGRPVVCLDVGGPALQVTPETGYAATVTSPQVAVDAMASYLKRISEDRTLLAEFSAKARARARATFSSRRVGADLSGFYAEAVAAYRKF